VTSPKVIGAVIVLLRVLSTGTLMRDLLMAIINHPTPIQMRTKFYNNRRLKILI
jgi:hypothetical protein